MRNSVVALTAALVVVVAPILGGCAADPVRVPNNQTSAQTSVSIFSDGYVRVAQTAASATQVVDGEAEAEASITAAGVDLSTHITSGEESSDSLSEPLGAPEDLWERIRRRFALPTSNHNSVQREKVWYTRHPDYLSRVEKRAAPYLFHVVEEIERRGMPGELALLPIVESGYQPWAYSHERASGLWQFIPSTGDQYGLRRSWWYDGRRDVMESTRAALDYLTRLYALFEQDWLVAIAAYNSGEGRVLEARRRNRAAGKPTDFWHLELPRETRDYVPRLLAAAEIVSDPLSHGVTLVGIPDEPYFQVVPVGSQLDLVVASNLLGMEIEDLFRLNPAFKRWATDPDGPHRLLVPVDRAREFAQALAELPEERRLRWARHQVRYGDTLSEIAKQYGTTASAVRKANALKGDFIREGKDLLIPLSGGDLPVYALNLSPQAAVGSGGKIVYTVQPGDSLWEIARRFGVKLRRLATWNGLSTRDFIHPGQDLVLYAGKKQVVKTKATGQRTQRIQYTVKQGDSLDRISRRFNVTVSEIREWNVNDLGGPYIHPGQELTLYVDLTRQTL
ncbi:MAG: LysM peptidoglycan-binding domain-containing protein [Chromatiales bacterium]|nr:LysM peptidoglycan-binding domain-containing protein [Chromatiales bacterium]